MMTTAQELSLEVGVRVACEALGVSPATFYRHRKTSSASKPPSGNASSPRAPAPKERQTVLATLNSERFAQLRVQVQEQNEAITNLYVASHRVHATLEADEVMTIIKEILVELVGAEEFGILLLDTKKNRLELVANEGVRDRLPAESIPMGDGVIGDVASTGEPFFFEPKTPKEQEAGLPLAAIPLQVNGSSVGVVVIYKLLGQKHGFSPIDHQLLELLAAHAATALVSARLHSAMDRRLKTVEGFVQLMKPN